MNEFDKAFERWFKDSDLDFGRKHFYKSIFRDAWDACYRYYVKKCNLNNL